MSTPERQRLVERAAAAIANARGGRRGLPPIVNVLELLPGHLREEVMVEAEAVVEAIGAHDLLATMDRIQEMAAEEIRLGAYVQSSIWQIEADARAAIAKAKGGE